jgi:hypothetical protein
VGAKADRIAIVAGAIYEALKETGSEGALVCGRPRPKETTFLDGEFDLRAVTRMVLREIDSPRINRPKHRPV